MNTSNTRIEATMPQALMRPHPAYKWQLLKDERGFSAVHWFDVNALTPEERKARDDIAAEYCFEPPWVTEQDDECTRTEDHDRPRFPTLALAREWALLQDALNNIDDDMAAFGAPSECRPAALRPLIARAEALLALSDRPQTIKEFT